MKEKSILIVLFIAIIVLLLGNLFYRTWFLKSELSSINKALAHRELVAKTLLNRDEFLRYQLSKSNIRISALEQRRHVEVVHKWEPLPNKKGKG